MQQKCLPPPSDRPVLPPETLPRADPRQEAEEALAGRCSPEEAWKTLEPAGRDRLREAWVRVLKEVVGDARDR